MGALRGSIPALANPGEILCVTNPSSPGVLRLHALGTPRAQCSGCGASCSSYRVGPLTPDDEVRLEAALPAVRAAFPDIPDGDPRIREVRGDSERIFLRKRDGYCVLWKRGVGCTVHAAAGSEAKPLVCRLFPLQLIRSETGIRIGMRPSCLADADVWHDGPPVAPEFIQEMLEQPFGTIERNEPPGEAVLLQVLALHDLDTATVLSFLAQRPNRDDPPRIDEWLEARLRALFTARDSVVGGEFPEDAQGPLHPATSTATGFAMLRSFVESGRGVRDGRWPEVDAAFRPYLRDALRRLVYIRQNTLFGTPAWALIGYVAAARWASSWARHDGSVPDPVRFGRMFSTLLIVLQSPRMQQALTDGGPPFE